jgi:hypothetical protein
MRTTHSFKSLFLSFSRMHTTIYFQCTFLIICFLIFIVFQREAMLKAKPILEESIAEVYLSSSPECLKVADFGCSSGPNTLLLIWLTMDTIHATCQGFNRKAPMFQVFLNDLPGNDFNFQVHFVQVFQEMPSFYEKLKKDKGSEFGPCFIAGMPGNFYGRLFPNHFLHFVHSSYCLHWRSQVNNFHLHHLFLLFFFAGSKYIKYIFLSILFGKLLPFKTASVSVHLMGQATYLTHF